MMKMMKIPPFHLVKYQCLAAVSGKQDLVFLLYLKKNVFLVLVSDIYLRSANLIGFCHGTTIGWCAPTIWLLLTEHSPLTSGTVSVNESSWIGSVLYLGSIIGNCLFSIISKYFGAKIAMSLLALPNLVRIIRN